MTSVLCAYCVVVETGHSAFFSCSHTFTIWTLSLNHLGYCRSISWSILSHFASLVRFLFLILFLLFLFFKTRFLRVAFPLLKGIRCGPTCLPDFVFYIISLCAWNVGFCTCKRMLLCRSSSTSWMLMFGKEYTDYILVLRMACVHDINTTQGLRVIGL